MMIFLLLFDGCIESPHMSEIDRVENHISINDHTVIRLDGSFLYDGSVDEIDMAQADHIDAKIILDHSIESTHSIDPVDPVEALEPSIPQVSICMPQVIVPHDSYSFAQSLKSWVDELEMICTLETGLGNQSTPTQLRTTAHFGDAGYEHCDEGGCWQTLPSRMKQWTETINPYTGVISSKRTWVATIDTRLSLEDQSLETMMVATHLGSDSVQHIRRHWDSNGRILFEKYGVNNRTQIRSFYEWSGNALTQGFINYGQRGYESRANNFTYNSDGYLIQANEVKENRSSTHKWQSIWTYTTKGQPQAVTLQFAYDHINHANTEVYKTWLKQAWYYTEDGHLQSRSVWINPKRRDQTNIISYGVVIPKNQQEWDQTITLWDDQHNCIKLPRSFMHGYPSTGRFYDLGWGLKHRPKAINVYHGGQDTDAQGVLGWFGHFGVGSETDYRSDYLSHAKLLSSMNSDHPMIVEINTEYDLDGRPLNESAFLYNRSFENLEAVVGIDENRVMVAQRRWVWEEDRLVQDRLDRVGKIPRTLEFNYNHQNKLMTRVLKRGNQIIAQHEWTYRDEIDLLPEIHHIAEYKISYNENALMDIDDAILNNETLLDTQFIYTSTLENNNTKFNIYESQNEVLMLEFDTQGRLIKQVGDMSVNAFEFDAVSIRYDGRHNKISHLSRLDHNGQETALEESYVFDAQGRLSNRYGVRDTVEYSEAYRYLCE